MFTPGPWHVVIDDTGGPYSCWPSIYAPEKADLTIIHRAGFKQEFWGDLNIRITLANARLIAEAPAMYEALGKKDDWAEKLYQFLITEYEAIPTSGEVVTSDVRPHFNALCDFLAARGAILERVDK